MKISQVRVFPLREASKASKLKGLARICIEDSLQLTGLRIYQGTNGLFVSYPNDPNHKGEDYKQLYYPVQAELRREIEKAVLESYEFETSDELKPGEKG